LIDEMVFGCSRMKTNSFLPSIQNEKEKSSSWRTQVHHVSVLTDGNRSSVVKWDGIDILPVQVVYVVFFIVFIECEYYFGCSLEAPVNDGFTP
jgi:hypothetical protein